MRKTKRSTVKIYVFREKSIEWPTVSGKINEKMERGSSKTIKLIVLYINIIKDLILKTFEQLCKSERDRELER